MSGRLAVWTVADPNIQVATPRRKRRQTHRPADARAMRGASRVGDLTAAPALRLPETLIESGIVIKANWPGSSVGRARP